MNNLENPAGGAPARRKRLLIALGACLTLPATPTFLSGSGTGLCMLLALLMSELAVVPMRKSIPPLARAIAFFTINATLHALIYLLSDKLLPALCEAFGAYLPLSAIGGLALFLAHEEEKKAFGKLFRLGAAGVDQALILALVGGTRELLGRGSVFGAPVWSFAIGYFTHTASAFFLYALCVACFFPALACTKIANNRRNVCDGALALSFFLTACHVFTLIG